MIKKIFLSTILLLVYSSLALAQVVSFPDTWSFKIGDDSAYKEINLDDSGWEKISVTRYWESQGHNKYDGFAWYRLHFKIDKKLLNKELYLLVGKIDDCDETFLNGIFVGATGGLPPKYFSEYNTQRAYKIPRGALKEKNVLAVRVYDGMLDGGIYGGVFGIYNKQQYVHELNLGPAPKKSFYQLVTANGLISAVYNEREDLIENAFPHLFRYYDEDNIVKPFIKSLKLKTAEKPEYAGYLENTHIINVKYRDFAVKYFAPFTAQQKILYAVVEGKSSAIMDLNFYYQKDYCDVLADSLIKINPAGPSQKIFLFSFNDSIENHSSDILKAKENLAGANIIPREIHYMKKVFARCFFPKNISKAEKALYEQSIAFLKMAQVSQKEIFVKSRGQILASLPPGGWNMGWLRDGTYSILALNRLGLFTEAKEALEFFLYADAGFYKHYVFRDGIDYGVKTDYRLSVCRYFGIGKEEADFNDNGPNIELDGFGLFLNALTDYVKRSGDEKFFLENKKILTALIADPILTFIDKNDLIRKESGPWETHLPGDQYAYTSIVCASGLRNLAEKLKSIGSGSYQKYFDAADKLTSGIKENLIYNGKMIKGFFEARQPDTYGFYDGGTIEAFNDNLFRDRNFFNSYYRNLEKGLRISRRRGFSRLNNPDWYTIGEWPFLDLRIASALIKYGRKKEAKQLIDWITDNSRYNFNMIAELYNYKTESYDGAVPMVGFGAGAYIISLCDYFSGDRH